MRRRRSPYSWRIIEENSDALWGVLVAVLVIGLLMRWFGWG